MEWNGRGRDYGCMPIGRRYRVLYLPWSVMLGRVGVDLAGGTWAGSVRVRQRGDPTRNLGALIAQCFDFDQALEWPSRARRKSTLIVFGVMVMHCLCVSRRLTKKGESATAHGSRGLEVDLQCLAGEGVGWPCNRWAKANVRGRSASRD